LCSRRRGFSIGTTLKKPRLPGSGWCVVSGVRWASGLAAGAELSGGHHATPLLNAPRPGGGRRAPRAGFSGRWGRRRSGAGLFSRNEIDGLARTLRRRPTNFHSVTEWKGWKLLGYDVADRFLTSGMLWFRAGEAREALRRERGPHLNKLHFFRRESATRFQEFGNRRAPDHRPYFVYSLFRSGQRTAGRSRSP
jgi:hypothetical protein